MSDMKSCLVALVLSLTVLSNAAPTTVTNCTYVSRTHIGKVFNNLAQGNFSAFFSNVIDDVDWNVQGSHPLAGRYTNKTAFYVNAVARLAQVENLDFPDVITVINIIGGCSEEWSVQELREQAVMKNGRPLSSTFFQSNQD